MTDSSPIPAGFGPPIRSSPLLEALGGFYTSGSGSDLQVGLLVGQRHTNSRGNLHGGVLATLADIGMGYQLSFASDPPRRFVTVNLNIDYVAAAHLGEWLAVEIESSNEAGRLVFASARLLSDTRVVARARAVFSLTARPASPAPSTP